MATAKQKKTFLEELNSPASAFISAPIQEEPREKKETKSVRVNLLFRPSTKTNIEKLAYLKKSSLNDFINTVLDEYISEHEDDIARYDSIFGD